MTKLFTLCGLVTVSLCAQGPRGGRYPNPGAGWLGLSPRATVTGAPYSAVQTTQTQRVLSDGNQVSRTEEAKVYRDSQGRTRVERPITPPASSGKQPYTEATIVDPVAGYRYILNSSTMTAIQTPLPAHAGSATGSTPPVRTGRAGSVQTTTVSLGTQIINSVTATGTQVTEIIPAATISNAQAITVVRTTWISTDLKVPVQIKSGDPRFGTSDFELTNILQASPDSSLFTVPPGYTVKTGGFGGGGRGAAGGAIRRGQ